MTDPLYGQSNSLDLAAEQLVDSLRDLIAALEEPPSLGDAETHLLENLRRTLAEWEADRPLPLDRECDNPHGLLDADLHREPYE